MDIQMKKKLLGMFDKLQTSITIYILFLYIYIYIYFYIKSLPFINFLLILKLAIQRSVLHMS